MSATGYKRVYMNDGAYYYVDPAKKWHKLCRVEDGEPAMLRALAKVKGKLASGIGGSMVALIEEWESKFLSDESMTYSAEVKKDYGYLLGKLKVKLRDFEVGDVDAPTVIEVMEQWEAKPRSANKVRMLLSVIFTYAIGKPKWKVRSNPVRDAPRAKAKPHRRYMPNAELLAIGQGAVTGRRYSGTGKAWRNANGAMYAALFDFAYLTGLRAKDCRFVRWPDIDRTPRPDMPLGVVLVEPSKTRGSTGMRLAHEITPDIVAVLNRVRALDGERKVSSMFVFHTLKGGQFSASAIKSAWRRARERALGDTPMRERPQFRHLRPKALSDARRRGLSLDALKDAAGHASVTTTETYLVGFDIVDAKLGLSLPQAEFPNSDTQDVGKTRRKAG